MANVFTNAGEFRRGKGNKKTRLGPRTRVEYAGHRGEKQAQAPNDIAYRKLLKLLEKPGLTKADRYDIANSVKNAEQLRFMNMPVLSEVLLYMKNVGNVINLQTMNYAALGPYIERLLPRRETHEAGGRVREITEDELQIMRLRMAATFLRYISYVKNIIEEANREAQEAQTRERETPTIED